MLGAPIIFHSLKHHPRYKQSVYLIKLQKWFRTYYNHWYCLLQMQYTDAHSVSDLLRALESVDNRTNGIREFAKI